MNKDEQVPNTRTDLEAVSDLLNKFCVDNNVKSNRHGYLLGLFMRFTQEKDQQNKELVEALKEVVRISDRKHDAWDKAKAVLNKLKQHTDGE